MDKYEYNLKLDKMKSLAAEGNYRTAAELADTINWRKIKNVTALARAGEIYEQVERYEESRELLLMAHNRSPMGRAIIYRLACVATKLKKYDEAWGYYKEFVEVAPCDNLKYVLKYKINKAEGADYQTLILSLEDLKEQEPTEEWGYELAYLYHQAGMREKCVEACDEVFLYFGHGTYVEKALELKMLYQSLTPQQEESYKQFKQEKEDIAEVESEDVLEPEEDVTEEAITESEEEEEVKEEESSDQSHTRNLQETLQKSMQKFMGDVERKETLESHMNAIKKLVKDIPYMRKQEEVKQKDYITEYVKQKETEKAEVITEPLKQKEVEMTEVMTEVMTETVTEPSKQEEVEMTEVMTETVTEPLKQEEVEMTEVMTEVITEPLKQEEPKMVKWEKTENIPKTAEINKKQEEQDGQIRIVLPNGKVFESQITGQMSFDEIVKDWERTMQTAASALKEEQTKQKSIKEKASQEAGDILERLIDVIPGANTGQRPKPAAIKEKEKAAQMVADMNQRLQKEIDRISTENAQIEERIVAAQDSVVQDSITQESVTRESVTRDSVANQELAAEIHAVMERQSRLAEEKYSFEEKETLSEEVLLEETLLQEALSEEILSEKILSEEILSEKELVTEILVDELAEKDTVDTFYEENLDKETFRERTQIDAFINESETLREETKKIESEKIAAQEIAAQEVAIEEIGIEEIGEAIFKASELDEISLEEIAEEPEEKIEETLKEERPFKEEPDEEFLIELSQGLIGRLEESTEELIPEIELPEDLNLEIELTGLSQEQRETFSYITHIKGMEEQICIALSGIASRLKQGRTSNTGNLIVMGGSGSGKTVFATNFIKVLQQMTGKPNGKVGKIGASVLNEKDINGLFGKIAGGCLIVESAGDLTEESTRTLGFLLEQDTQGTLVILEGSKHEIEKVLMRDKEFASKFSERIKIPIFTNDELVIFAKAYAAENGYVIDEMGILALYNSISNIQKLDRETTIAEVKEIVDDAIAHVESGALKKAFSILTSSRFDEEDYVILHEKDFNN